MKFLNKKLGLEVICYLFVFLFAYTGISKYLLYNNFRIELMKSSLTRNYATPIAIFVPMIEIAIAILLLINSTRKFGLYCSLALMVIFTSYVFYLLAFAPYLPCHCAGIIETMTWTQHLIFNIALIATSVIGIWLNNKQYQSSGSPSIAPVSY